jgi:hypothetical protein
MLECQLNDERRLMTNNREQTSRGLPSRLRERAVLPLTKRPWRGTWIAFLASILAMGAHRALPADEGSTHGPRIVMIIRHAEKPEGGNAERSPDLSPRGYERAAALAKVIPEHFPKPDFLIATKRSRRSNRPVETITPLSKALHERIDATFRDEAFQEVARAVLTDPKYAGKVVLIAWHH